jgi:hypothetical protein
VYCFCIVCVLFLYCFCNFIGYFNFKGLTARRFCKSFGVKGLMCVAVRDIWD